MTSTQATPVSVELQIAVVTPLHQTFTYAHDKIILPGVRVLVPFGSQPRTLGVVVEAPELSSDSKPPELKNFKIKAIKEVLDQEPVYSPILLKLATWLANYYMHPIGEVLRTMLPASSSKSTNITYELTDEGAHAPESENIRPIIMFAKKRTVTQATLKKKFKELGHDTTTSTKILDRWIKLRWITIAKEKSIRTRQLSDSNLKTLETKTINDESFRLLNDRQAFAVNRIITEGLNQTEASLKRPFLLFGVTGSGKTEVFLHVIRNAIQRSISDNQEKAQTLVLVPEISLTPQMTKIFEERFPGLVSVVHSAMEDSERWKELDRIRRGDALILIGPRSAIFGPFANLKLIIVDEEHDSSYKQGSGLLYNARDVAIVRAGMEQATVVLGSATPSMESWQNAISGKYTLLEMPERASTKPLPDVQIIAGKPSFKAMSLVRGDHVEEGDSPFEQEVIDALAANLLSAEQSIVLVNRRGFGYYLLCVDDRKAAGCPHCSISLSVHGRRKILRCHYCDYTTTMHAVIAENPQKTWAVVGYGSQKAEDQLNKIFPEARITRLDSDTVQDPLVLPQVLNKFRNGEIDILVGTQILAKGHDFPNVTLIAILEVDQLLGLPDFRGGERTFQLLVQAAGRSGRGTKTGKVIVQSLRGGHPVVQSALSQNFPAFAKDELEFRKTMGYPPFGKLVLFEINGPDPGKLDKWCRELESQLGNLLSENQLLSKNVRVLGPAAAPIEVIRGRTRRTILILGTTLTYCRKVATALAQMTMKPPHEIRVKIDVDPQSTL